MARFDAEQSLGLFRVLSIVANRWNQNCHIIAHDPSHSCVVIDPGYGAEEICENVSTNGLRVVSILATHTHFDHIASVSAIQERFGAPEFLFHAEDTKVFKSANLFAMIFGAEKVAMPEVFSHFTPGEPIRFESELLRIGHYPGHTPGSCVIAFQGAIFTGDLLIPSQERFEKLPGFNLKKLQASIQAIFEDFLPDTLVFPGHGKTRTLEAVRQEFLLAEEMR